MISAQKLRRTVLAVVILSVAGFLAWRLPLAFRIHKHLTAIKAAGLPISGEQLSVWQRSLCLGSNAAPLLKHAFGLGHDFDDPKSKWLASPLLDYRAEWSEEMREVLSEYIRMNADELGAAKHALELSNCCFLVDYSSRRSVDLSYLAPMKRLALLFAYRACLSALSGKADLATADLNTMLRLAAALRNEPDMISQKVRHAVIRITVRAAERILNSAHFGQTSVADLSRTFNRALDTNGLWLAWIGERAQFIPCFRLEFEDPDNLPSWYRWSARVAGWHQQDFDFFLSADATNLATALLEPPASLRLRANADSLESTALRLGYDFAGGIIHSWRRLPEDYATTLACVREATTALALRRYEAEKGFLPEDLKDLVPRFISTVPIDPFDGKPLRYLRLAKGFELYSIAEDLIDDSGRRRALNLQKMPDFSKTDWRDAFALRYAVPLTTNSEPKPTYDLTFVVER